MTREVNDTRAYELSIVVPIYNGEEYIEKKLESLSGIENVSYEVIISLNKCNDKSEQLIDKFCKGIPNVKILRHETFLGGLENYSKGFYLASGEFILNSAVDDICDKEFYREGIDLLRRNPEASAVSPITQYEDYSHGIQPITFALLGSAENRLKTLFQNIRVSHGIFYSLMRREIAYKLNHNYALEYGFVGGDWLLDTKLALTGAVLRTEKNKCVFGVKGVSNSKDALGQNGNNLLKRILPYSTLALKIIKLSKGKKFKIKLILIIFAIGLIKGNLHRYFFSRKNLINIYRKVYKS